MGLLPLVNNIMKFDVVDIKGKKVGDLTVDKDVFGINPNEAAVRQAILSELNNMRQGTHSTKNRALVNGGGKKPWKQRVAELQGQELSGPLYGEVAELYLVQSLMRININFQKN